MFRMIRARAGRNMHVDRPVFKPSLLDIFDSPLYTESIFLRRRFANLETAVTLFKICTGSGVFRSLLASGKNNR